MVFNELRKQHHDGAITTNITRTFFSLSGSQFYTWANEDKNVVWHTIIEELHIGKYFASIFISISFSYFCINRIMFDGYLPITFINIYGLVYFTLVMFLQRDYEVSQVFVICHEGERKYPFGTIVVDGGNSK